MSVKNKSKLQKISEVENPVVGKFYLVPHCVGGSTGFLWPVIGPWHEDADIGVEKYHFHYDFRFIPESWSTNMATVHAADKSAPEYGKNSVPLMVWKRKKMLRPMPDFPFWRLNAREVLVEKFKDVKMKCMTCPHRGMPLQGLPVKEDGTVVCNGHGLRWRLRDGKMIPH